MGEKREKKNLHLAQKLINLAFKLHQGHLYEESLALK
jgi:hypothetical protein